MMNKRLVIGLIFLLILSTGVSAQYFYEDEYYGGYGFGGFGGDIFESILNMYESNPYLFDFFIFLLIFIGITSVVFKERFKETSSKAISLGVSLTLAFGLVMWERNTGITLFTMSSVFLFIISILVFYVLFAFIEKIANKWVAGCFSYVITYLIFFVFVPSDMVYWLGNKFMNILPLLYLLFWVCLIAGILGLFFGKGKKAVEETFKLVRGK